MTPPCPPVPPSADALRRHVADALGLDFPASRQAELLRGFARAAQALGFADGAACLAALLAAPPARERLEVLASHLTIGETYFFRDPAALEALVAEVLVPLIADRRRQGRLQLHLWSAGCSTGEEAYTLAILLHRLLPDLAHWQVRITATDVNAEALRRAVAGRYGAWSFRNAPAWLQPRYFVEESPGRHTVLPGIRSLVQFGFHNLAAAGSTGMEGAPSGVDVLLCRNVLMYFEPAQLPPAIARLRGSLAAGGWLVTSPGEATRALFPGFAAAEFPGCILFRREEAAHSPAPVSLAAQADHVAEALPEGPAPGGHTAPCDNAGPVGLQQAAARARVLADRGQLDDALRWCDQWLEGDRLAAPAHHLRAMVLIEQGRPEAARSALQKVLYLVPGFVLAHVALGQLDLQAGAEVLARRHFARAQQALRALPLDAPLPGAEDLTAGQFEPVLRRLATPRGAA